MANLYAPCLHPFSLCTTLSSPTMVRFTVVWLYAAESRDSTSRLTRLGSLAKMKIWMGGVIGQHPISFVILNVFSYGIGIMGTMWWVGWWVRALGWMKNTYARIITVTVLDA